MGKLSRTKGATGELAIAHIISELTGLDVRRRVRQHGGDSDLVGIPGWSAEVKRAKKPSLLAWWEQTVCNAVGVMRSPVLFYRVDRKKWRAVCHVSSLLFDAQGPCMLSGDFMSPEHMVEMSPESWAILCGPWLDKDDDDC